MKKLVLFIVVVMGPLSAVAYQGRVTVTQTLNLKVSEGMGTIPQGIYDFTMSQRSKKLLFEVRLAGDDNNPVFKIVSPKPFPASGTFQIPSTLSGQPYDVQGDIKTSQSVSNPMWERIQCQAEIKKYVCHTTPNGQQVCKWEWYLVNGYQDQQFQYRNENRDIMVILLAANTGTIEARFDGNEQYSTKDILYMGPCDY